jgi:hypothetical protein
MTIASEYSLVPCGPSNASGMARRTALSRPAALDLRAGSRHRDADIPAVSGQKHSQAQPVYGRGCTPSRASAALGSRIDVFV